ncbi:hypothetical protein AC249_AIPGENE6469 [Exaiptasia diaphana]|nr:hypothetical protein AC249_AIPGENE6469 [Exaiptasia diaphana]
MAQQPRRSSRKKKPITDATFQYDEHIDEQLALLEQEYQAPRGAESSLRDPLSPNPIGQQRLHRLKYLRFGWPISYTADHLPKSTFTNHPSAENYSEHVQHYIDTEKTHNAIAGPFVRNPLNRPLICSPLQTVPKRGSTKRRVVMDLSFPTDHSVNAGIASGTYMNKPFRLRLPGIDRLCSFILLHGPGCLIYKKDLQRAYRQFLVDPKDYFLLGFMLNRNYYFDLRCPFGLRSSAMICQRTTSAVIHVFKQFGYVADVYLDDFFGAENSPTAHQAFLKLQDLFDELGLQSSKDKDCPPSTRMICLGIEVDTVAFTLRVPQDHINDLLVEIQQWFNRANYTKKQLQSLIGRLSFVTACVRPGRIFMSRLLNNLRLFPSKSRTMIITPDMYLDLSWWSSFLPLFNGVTIIKPEDWIFEDLKFATDACLCGGGATCLDQCFSFEITQHIQQAANHISALELYVIAVAVRVWAPLLSHRKVIVACNNQAAVTVISGSEIVCNVRGGVVRVLHNAREGRTEFSS